MARSGVLAALLIGAAPVIAQTYYVTPSGSDAASGLSPSSSWRSLAKVNSAAFAPGDTILFAGGGVWTGSLNPHASGTSSAAITFGVVGTGQAVLEGAGASGYAGIDVEGRSNLAFSNFEIRNWHGNAQAVYLAGDRAISFSSIYAHDNDEGFHVSPSSATSGVTITGGSVVNTGHSGSGGVGINIPVGTTGVSVTSTLVDNVADSCIIDKGSGSIYDGLTIRHCGFGVAAYGTHGIYMRGPGIVLRNSDISDAHDDCVSVRFQGDVVEHNRIHNCPIGIGWFEYATAPGVVRFFRNVISNAGTGIYIDGSSTQHFAIANNTIIGAGSFGPTFEGINVDTVGGAVPGLALENNILVGAITPLIKVDAASNFVERANTLHTSLGFRGVWRGVNASSLAAFGALTGQGAGDITADPQLVSADPTTPDAHVTSSSPSINHGVADTAAATLTPSCDGSDVSYCGSAPDMGAIEFGNASAPPPGSPCTAPWFGGRLSAVSPAT